MDASDPAAGSSTTEISADPPSSASRPARPATNYAFLIHSPDSVTNKLAPTVDNKALARQRRRRTSPEDQAILEYEFARDSKPDKASRARIAARVALGEKEVQIWFQNRRSTARRRTSPYVPPEHLPSPSDVQAGDLDPILAALRSPSSQENQRGSGGASSSDFHREGQHDTITSTITTITTTKPAVRTLARSSSSVRLSLTSNGGARILHSDETTPSPPRPSQSSLSPSASSASSSSARGLRRSYSAAGLTDSFVYSQSSQPLPRSLRRSESSGRSRDSRAWEFWCDADARNDLAKHAEQDQKGSAADAIGLIRSQGRNRTLTEITGDSDGRSRSKRVKSSHRALRPTLRQSKSSMASIGFSNGATLQIFEDEPAKSTLKSPARQGAHDPGNPDSDKENWDPDNIGRSGTISKSNKVLEQTKTLKQSRSLTRPTRQGSPHKGDDADQDEEVSEFMRSSNPRARRGDDIDCIQGLLFLSQGSWK